MAHYDFDYLFKILLLPTSAENIVKLIPRFETKSPSLHYEFQTSIHNVENKRIKMQLWYKVYVDDRYARFGAQNHEKMFRGALGVLYYFVDETDLQHQLDNIRESASSNIVIGVIYDSTSQLGIIEKNCDNCIMIDSGRFYRDLERMLEKIYNIERYSINKVERYTPPIGFSYINMTGRYDYLLKIALFNLPQHVLESTAREINGGELSHNYDFLIRSYRFKDKIVKVHFFLYNTENTLKIDVSHGKYSGIGAYGFWYDENFEKAMEHLKYVLPSDSKNGKFILCTKVTNCPEPFEDYFIETNYNPKGTLDYMVNVAYDKAIKSYTASSSTPSSSIASSSITSSSTKLSSAISDKNENMIYVFNNQSGHFQAIQFDSSDKFTTVGDMIKYIASFFHKEPDKITFGIHTAKFIGGRLTPIYREFNIKNDLLTDWNSTNSNSKGVIPAFVVKFL